MASELVYLLNILIIYGKDLNFKVWVLTVDILQAKR